MRIKKRGHKIGFNEFIDRNKYKILISLVLTIISFLSINYETHNCVRLVRDVLLVGCDGILGVFTSLFSVIPIFSEIFSLAILLNPPTWLDWLFSFVLYYLIFSLVIFLINKMKGGESYNEKE